MNSDWNWHSNNIWTIVITVALTGLLPSDAISETASTKGLQSLDCALKDAAYTSGEYSVRFGPTEFCLKEESATCDYIFEIRLERPNLTIIGSSTIPNGFARQFYTMDFPNYNEQQFERMGAFYFISTKANGEILPTDGHASLEEPAPSAVVLPELSRQLYYMQRGGPDDLILPPSDIFVLSGCSKADQ